MTTIVTTTISVIKTQTINMTVTITVIKT